MKNKLATKGYTMVELLIIITITGLLVTFSFSGYTKNQERQTALAVKESIMTVLQEAQQQATIGENDCSALSGVFQGVEVTLQNSSITKLSKCKNGGGTGKETPIPNATFSNTYTIIFQPLGTGVNLGGPSALDLNYQLNSKNYRINIAAPGVITYMGAV